MDIVNTLRDECEVHLWRARNLLYDALSAGVSRSCGSKARRFMAGFAGCLDGRLLREQWTGDDNMVNLLEAQAASVPLALSAAVGAKVENLPPFRRRIDWRAADKVGLPHPGPWRSWAVKR